MTVHWNSQKGFSDGLPTASSGQDDHEDLRAVINELRLSLRKTPDQRAAVVRRAKKLLADPAYPSREVLRKTAALLVEHLRPRCPE